MIGARILDFYFPLDLPSENELFARLVVDEHGSLLRAFADENGIWRYPISLEEVSPRYLEALLNYEDRWFWYHPGINPGALGRALIQNIVSGRIVSGGSTISMQVARLLHPHSRTINGKLKQMLRTIQLEWHLNKEEILTLYLNIAPFGGTVEGVQAASYTYLNKPAAQLTHAEAALMVALPQSPTRFRPDKHSQSAQRARDKVLDRMSAFGVWSKEAVAEAKLEPIQGLQIRRPQLAPLLARRLVAGGDGQRAIRTTINADLQQGLEDYLRSYISQLPPKSSAAILVVDNKNRSVKAYLGSADFADQTRFGHVDMVRAVRSPGSTLKPFLYGLALDEGLIHSKSLLADVPRFWGEYRPSNFNQGFSGPVSVTEALQRSLNVPAVGLLERYGVNRFANRLENAGLALTVPADSPNLSLILGGSGISLERLVSGYMAFARAGKTTALRYYQENLTQQITERHLLSPESAWVVQHIMTGIARPDGLNALGHTLARAKWAWKTGTSYGFRDAWAIAVNPDHTIGVWVGRPDGTPMPGHSGRITAGPLLFAVADHLQTDKTEVGRPEKVELATICWPLGTAANEQSKNYCQIRHRAYVIDGLIPPTWHQLDDNDWQGNLMSYWVNTETGLRVNAHCGVEKIEQRQVALWPKVLEPWIPRYQTRRNLVPKTDPACPHRVVGPSGSLQIAGIQPDSVYHSADPVTPPSLNLKALGGQGRLHWYINGRPSYGASPTKVIPFALERRGRTQILVIDEAGNVDKVEVFRR